MVKKIEEVGSSLADIILKDKYGSTAKFEDIIIPEEQRGKCCFGWCGEPADEYWCTENLDYFKVHGGKKDGAIQRGGGGNLMRTCHRHTWLAVDICKYIMLNEVDVIFKREYKK